MEYTNLGRTALRVSRLCLGTLNFGARVSPDDSHVLMDRALDLGINLFDTANSYGWQVHRGYTEEILGSWFATGGRRRDRVILATKVFSEMDPWPNNSGLSARHIIAACEASLRRMRTDWIDVYQMHHVDRTAPWDEVWQALETLTAQGKIRYAGSSNFAGWHLSAAQESAARRNFLGLVSEQCVYNLVTRHVEMEVIPAAQAYGLGVLVWSPLHGGLLGGALRKQRDGTAVKSAQGRAVEALTTLRAEVQKYEDLCADLAEDPARVGLAWVLSRPGVTAPVVGPRTVEHLEAAAGTLDLTLPESLLAQLDQLFPPVGRGGPAPEAWCW